MARQKAHSLPARTLTLATLAGGLGAAGASLAFAGALGAAGLASHLARKIVVPPKAPAENVKVHSLGYPSTDQGPGAQPSTISLEATASTLAPGSYGFYFSAGAGFALLGEVISYHPSEGRLVRPIEKIFQGDMTGIKRGRLSGVVARTPQEAGYRAKDIELNLPNGPSPAWLIHPQAAQGDQASDQASDQGSDQAPAGKPSSCWAIMIHGMGATRAETLRALEATQALGLSSLHMSYRNDREAPSSEDGRYGLGFTEWKDVEVAIDYALSHGAQQVVLFGWSMGGSIALQTADLARNRRAIQALVLDGPALDWLGLIEYHTDLNKIPLRIGQLGISMITRPPLTAFTGLKEPISLEQISWPHRAGDIQLPTLILHSIDDSYVPYQPSQVLSQLSDLVDFIPFERASHTREWNVDPQGWTQAVSSWLRGRNVGVGTGSQG